MKDSRVDAALAWLRDLPERERRRVATGPFEAQAVLLIAGLDTEALMVQSVAHMVPERALVVLMGVGEERDLEASAILRRWTGANLPDACGARCLLVNQGPCGCPVPDRVAELRRRQRALLWACEAILRPEPVEPWKGSLKTTLGLFQRLCVADALDPTLGLAPGDRVHLRETSAAVRQRLVAR